MGREGGGYGLDFGCCRDGTTAMNRYWSDQTAERMIPPVCRRLAQVLGRRYYDLIARVRKIKHCHDLGRG